jgi:broad specificity phosphatase PhoE
VTLVEERLDVLEDQQRCSRVHECDRMPERLCRVRRRLYLMRHAEVSYVGERDPEVVRLTERGLEQAAAAHRALEDVNFDLVVTSSLPRTVETASVVAPGVEPQQWPEFDEWRGGQLGAIPPEELEEVFVGSLQIRDEGARFLGGESLGEALDRVLPAFDRLLAAEWETALGVFHGGVNRILVSHALAGGRNYFGNFEQAPACINVLDHGSEEGSGAGWIVRTVNYIPYDPLHPARTTTMEHLWSELKAWLDARS